MPKWVRNVLFYLSFALTFSTSQTFLLLFLTMFHERTNSDHEKQEKSLRCSVVSVWNAPSIGELVFFHVAYIQIACGVFISFIQSGFYISLMSSNSTCCLCWNDYSLSLMRVFWFQSTVICFIEVSREFRVFDPLKSYRISYQKQEFKWW